MKSGPPPPCHVVDVLVPCQRGTPYQKEQNLILYKRLTLIFSLIGIAITTGGSCPCLDQFKFHCCVKVAAPSETYCFSKVLCELILKAHTGLDGTHKPQEMSFSLFIQLSNPCIVTLTRNMESFDPYPFCSDGSNLQASD